MASDYASGQLITSTPANAFDIGASSPAVDNIRRTFGIGDKVAELAPETSIFFSYLSKLGKKPTDETVWRPLEYRNQWQRRNFKVKGAVITGGDDAVVTGAADVTNAGNNLTHILLWVDYDNTGKVTKSSVDPIDNATYVGYAPVFLAKNQVLRLNGEVWKLTGAFYYHKYVDADNTTVSTKAKAGTEIGYVMIPIGSLTNVSTGEVMGQGDDTFDTDGTNYHGQVIGSQWAEASGAPDGWRDELSSVEFFTQIFKTSVPLMSGSMQATKYRGYANEWKRIYAEHLKSHKMDLENAFLFGYGKYTSADVRNSWGLVPFLENNGGKRYQLEYSIDNNNLSGTDSTYDVQSKFNYDGIVDIMDDFMSYESGNSGQKLCLTSRKVINALHKVGDGNFVSNSMSGSSAKEIFRANLDVKSSSFMPIDVTSISTSWGSMNFIAHPLFRGDMEDKAVCADLSNVSLRPLAGNGISRDTFVETNVQENDIDGRKDMIITEAGLEVMLPETHATIDFVSSTS